MPWSSTNEQKNLTMPCFECDELRCGDCRCTGCGPCKTCRQPLQFNQTSLESGALLSRNQVISGECYSNARIVERIEGKMDTVNQELRQE